MTQDAIALRGWPEGKVHGERHWQVEGPSPVGVGSLLCSRSNVWCRPAHNDHNVVICSSFNAKKNYTRICFRKFQRERTWALRYVCNVELLGTSGPLAVELAVSLQFCGQPRLLFRCMPTPLPLLPLEAVHAQRVTRY